MDQELTGRLREALVAFEQAKRTFVRAQGRLNGMPPERATAYWRGPGQGIEQRMRLAAAEVVVAHRACLIAGLFATAEEQHLIAEARTRSATWDGGPSCS